MVMVVVPMVPAVMPVMMAVVLIHGVSSSRIYDPAKNALIILALRIPCMVVLFHNRISEAIRL